MSFAEANALWESGRAREIAQHYGLTAGETGTLKELITFRGAAGCFPSQEEVAKRVGVTLSAMKKYFAGLRRKGTIRSEKRGRARFDRYGRGWSGSKTHYIFDEWLDQFLGAVVEEVAAKPVQMELMAAEDPARSGAQIKPDRARSGADTEPERARNGTQTARQGSDMAPEVVGEVKHPGFEVRKPSFLPGRDTIKDGRKAGWSEKLRRYQEMAENPEQHPRLAGDYGIRNEEEVALTKALLEAPEIGVGEDWAQALAGVIRPREVFEQAVRYVDERARGEVRSPAALIYRLMHQGQFRPRRAKSDSDYFERFRDHVPGYAGDYL